MVAIVVNQSLRNSVMYEHICLEINNKLYKYNGKFNYQKQYKFILKALMISTTEGFNDNSPKSPSQYVTVKIKV